ncbi:MAG: hypothetical protein Q4E53_06455 [Eubacteriales bacterium]|nr:hypothetical protein [Eubacteriales bacterium]
MIENSIITLNNNEINWDMVFTYFKAYTHVDMNDIPEVYQDYVEPMLKVFREEAILKVKFAVEDIISKDNSHIVMRDEAAFTGKMIGKAYEDAKKVLMYVISVVNIDDLLGAHTDMMDSFFLEYWAVSVLNTIRETLYAKWQKEIEESEFKLTSIWSPGQSRFELPNQNPLFQLLKPEEIGVILDKHTRMVPLKTVSGTVGIVPKDSEILLIACDYCEHAKTCPGYKGKKYADITDRRLV